MWLRVSASTGEPMGDLERRYQLTVEDMGFCVLQMFFLYLAAAFMALSKLLNTSMPQFLHLKEGK